MVIGNIFSPCGRHCVYDLYHVNTEVSILRHLVNVLGLLSLSFLDSGFHLGQHSCNTMQNTGAIGKRRADLPFSGVSTFGPLEVSPSAFLTGLHTLHPSFELSN